MINSALEILTHINIYSVSIFAIILGILLSLVSERVKRGLKFPLQIFTIVWVILFGYKVYTGNNLYTALTTPSAKQIEAAKYEKIMIDGREVIWNKETGKVVKPSKK